MSDQETIEIVWNVNEQDALTKALNASARASDSAAKALQRQGQAAKFVAGPHQRLIDLNHQLARATAGGNTPAAMDINRAIARTQKQIAPRGGSSFSSRLTTFARSTRFNAGSVSPLAGRAADLLGLGEGAGGQLGIVAMAANAAAEGMKRAAEAGQKFGTLMLQTGSSGQTTGALQNIGASASQAAAFNERITSDPMARAYAARMGISNQPGAFGDQDWGRELLQAIKGIRKIANPTERLRAARAMGIDDNLTNLSDNTFNRMTGYDAQRQANIFDPKMAQGSAEFQSSLDHLKQGFENLNAVVWKAPMTGWTKFFNELADVANGNMTWKRFVTGQGEDEYGNATQGGAKTSQDKNTEALNANTAALKLPGTYGKDTDGRLGRALPHAGDYGADYRTRDDLIRQGFRMGAY